MKINIAYREVERDKALAVIDAVIALFPAAKVKQTDRKDEYRHCYIVIMNPITKNE